MTRKMLLLFLSSLLMLSVYMPAAQAKSIFSDVDAKQYSWAIEAINALTNKGILKGYPDGTFKPQNPVSKAEFTVMLYRLFDKYRPNTLPEPRTVRKEKTPNQYIESTFTNIKSFADVPNTYWAYKEINEVYDSQFQHEFNFNDKSELVFEPDHHLSRLETARLLSICFDEILNPEIQDNELLNILVKIKDVNVNVWKAGENGEQLWNERRKILGDKVDYSNITNYLLLSEYPDAYSNQKKLGSGDYPDYSVAKTIADFQKQGFITTDSNGMFRPTDTLSRAQIATIIYRIYKHLDSKGVLTKYSNLTIVPPVTSK